MTTESILQIRARANARAVVIQTRRRRVAAHREARKPVGLRDMARCPRCLALGVIEGAPGDGQPFAERSCMICGWVRYEDSPRSGRVPRIAVRYAGPHPEIADTTINVQMINNPNAERPDYLPECPFDGEIMGAIWTTDGVRDKTTSSQYACPASHTVRLFFEEGELLWR